MALRVNNSLFYETAKKVENLVGRRILPADFEAVEDSLPQDHVKEVAGNPESPSSEDNVSADSAVWGDW